MLTSDTDRNKDQDKHFKPNCGYEIVLSPSEDDKKENKFLQSHQPNTKYSIFNNKNSNKKVSIVAPGEEIDIERDITSDESDSNSEIDNQGFLDL